MTEITTMQTFFFFLTPQNIHMEFLCISEVAAGKVTFFAFQIKASHLHIAPK
jgi:hypothetical protein